MEGTHATASPWAVNYFATIERGVLYERSHSSPAQKENRLAWTGSARSGTVSTSGRPAIAVSIVSIDDCSAAFTHRARAFTKLRLTISVTILTPCPFRFTVQGVNPAVWGDMNSCLRDELLVLSAGFGAEPLTAGKLERA